MLDPIYRAAAAGGRCWSRDRRGRISALPTIRWIGGAGVSARDRVADGYVVSSCAHLPTLDLGCGPGRFTESLYRRGVSALGVDVCRAAVEMTRKRGADAILGDVFGPIPHSGRWERVLLADGNIGIGGDPLRTLRRASELIAPDGAIIAEVDPVGAFVGHSLVRWETANHVGPWFPWSRLDARELGMVAAAAGLVVGHVARVHERVIATLRPG